MLTPHDVRSNPELLSVAKFIGASDTNKHRVFEAIYFHKSEKRSLEYITERTGLSRTAVQKAGQALVSRGYISKEKSKAGFFYCKRDDVFSYKDKIMSIADNAAKLKNLEKALSNNSVQIPAVIRKPKTRRTTKKAKLLFVSSNPHGEVSEDGEHSILRPEVEFRNVKQAIRSASNRHNITVESLPAADIPQIIEQLNYFKPNILHFSGHGNVGVLDFDDGKVSGSDYVTREFSDLNQCLRNTDHKVKLLILNACNSAPLAHVFLENVDIVISMNIPISDFAAAEFSKYFYGSLASNQSVRSSFDQAVQMVGDITGEGDTPHIQYANPKRSGKIKFT